MLDGTHCLQQVVVCCQLEFLPQTPKKDRLNTGLCCLPWYQCYKTFLSVIFGFSLYARAFVPGKPFRPSLMFLGKARACPKEAPCTCCTLWQAPDLTHTHQTRLDKLARDYPSSVLHLFVNEGQKSYKTFASNCIKQFGHQPLQK